VTVTLIVLFPGRRKIGVLAELETTAAPLTLTVEVGVATVGVTEMLLVVLETLAV
jgi:hypothetical protein